jgi:uncharacterized protein YcfL
MKKILTLSALLGCSAILYTGCQTPAAVTITQSEGVLITTVDTGMKVWASYVTLHQNDGKVTATQVNNIEQAYNTYYDAQEMAKGLLELYVSNGTTNTVSITTANTAVANAEAALLNLINTYIK